MAQTSWFWTTGAGDGTPVSQDEFAAFWRLFYDDAPADVGVWPQYASELSVSTVGNNNIRIASGRALVHGMFYENDDDELDLNVASPSVGTTGCRVVLRKSWSARTVRAAIARTTDGDSAIPALTQTEGATWEIPLASFTITTDGVIAGLTDLRRWLISMRLQYRNWFGDGADGNVTVTGPVSLSRDMYYRNLTLSGSGVINANGYRIFVRDTLSMDGRTIHNNANSNNGGAAGTLGGGGNGGDAVGTLGGGGGGVVLVAAKYIIGSGTISANGGSGDGSGTSASAGVFAAGGTATPPATIEGDTHLLSNSPIHALSVRSLSGTPITGGGGGGANGLNNITSAGTSTTNSLGGSGGGSATPTKRGGGGGGGGVVIVFTLKPHDLTLQAAGGSPSGNANAGQAGTVLNLIMT